MTKPLSPSLEDYLEAVYALCREEGYIKPSAISRRLKVSKPSVNAAVKALASRGLLTYERYGAVSLTPAGEKAGCRIAERHGMLKDFFMTVLGLPSSGAETDACRAEHALGPETLRRIGRLAAFLKARPGTLRAARSALAGRKA